MMFILLTILCTWLASSAVVSLAPNTNTCPPITICKDTFRIFDNDDHSFTYSLRTHERNIGTTRDWSGFKPTEYELKLFFQNSSHYSGSVKIDGNVTQLTQKLVFNVDYAYVSFDYENITIGCDGAYRGSCKCIESATRYVGFDFTVLTLNDTLKSGENRIMDFSYFQSFAREVGPNLPAIGLRLPHGDNITVISTDFKLRYARTVFPCLDHPALKARFKFTVHHPAGFAAIAGTPLLNGGQAPGAAVDYEFASFHETAPISTSMFGFALTKGYTTILGSGAPFAQLHVSQVDRNQFDWILKALYEVGLYMNNTVGVPVPSLNISLVVLSIPPTPFISSYGLVFIDDIEVRHSVVHIVDKSLLYEMILRQYLGAIVTVSNWNEVCLLEGLTRAFKFTLYKAFWEGGRADLETTTETTLAEMCSKTTAPLTGNENEVLLDTVRCGEHAGIFFRSLAQIFGRQGLSVLLKHLLKRHSYGVAGLNEWDRELTLAVGIYSTLSGYLRNYFEHSGPTTLLLYFNEQERYVDINVHDESPTLPIPLKIYHPSSLSPMIDILTNRTKRIYLSSEYNWFLIDPDGHSYTIKVYTDVNFAAVFDPRVRDHFGLLNRRRIDGLLNDLCIGVMDNLFYRNVTGLSVKWRLALRFAYNLGPSCRCCLVHKSIASDCSVTELAACKSTVINHLF